MRNFRWEMLAKVEPGDRIVPPGCRLGHHRLDADGEIGPVTSVCLGGLAASDARGHEEG